MKPTIPALAIIATVSGLAASFAQIAPGYIVERIDGGSGEKAICFSM
jgi:hypothetical protein